MQLEFSKNEVDAFTKGDGLLTKLSSQLSISFHPTAIPYSCHKIQLKIQTYYLERPLVINDMGSFSSFSKYSNKL